MQLQNGFAEHPPGAKEAENSSWPTKLLTWYKVIKRDLPWRRTEDPYRIWVSEVMLQQTQVKTVIPYYQVFLQRFPSPYMLAQASLDEVLEVWKGLGYYSRARNLWRGAQYIVENFHGVLPSAYKALLQIPGIGEYTAGAVASIAFGERVPAVDGNVKRVMARLYAWEKDVGSAQSKRFFHSVLTDCMPLDSAGDFNQALMELGASLCSPRSPKCSDCPLGEDCRGYQVSDPRLYPVKGGRIQIKETLRPTLVVLKQGRVLVKRRPQEGLLANLWEFPGEEVTQVQSGAVWPEPFVGFSQDEGDRRPRGYRSRPVDLSVAEAGEEYGGEAHNAAGNPPDAEGNPLMIARDYWLNLYRSQVPVGSHEQMTVLLKKEFTVNGPVIHTYSHKRWRVYWIVLDLDEISVAEIGAAEIGASVKSGHEAERTESDQTKSYSPKAADDYRWVELSELDRLALPVAFQKVWEGVHPKPYAERIKK